MRTVTDAGSAPPSRGHIWQPSERALATAYSVVTEMDIPIHIARYVTVKAENKQKPSDSEWLKWILADEAKAKAELKRQNHEASRAKSWYSVAD